jgi:DNA-binding LacI/PurR family transcriptional regulator
MPNNRANGSDGVAENGAAARFAGIRQVAERSGVSPSTVSRVLSGRGYASNAAREAVWRAANDLGYEPHMAARALKSQSSHAIGVAIQDIVNPFFAAMARGISDASQDSGETPMLFDSQENADREAANLHVMLRNRVTGLIVAPTMNNVELLIRFQKHGIPIVQVDREVPGLTADSVLLDNFDASYEATAHLIRLGHTRIAVIAGPRTGTTGRQRLLGYESAMRDVGLEIRPEYEKISDYRAETGEALARALLEEDPTPTAVVAHNSVLAERLLYVVRERGVRIPDDLAVVSFDDAGWAALVSPPLTVVRQRAYDMGLIATETLLRRMREPNQTPVTRIELKGTLVVRGSCGGARTSPES